MVYFGEVWNATMEFKDISGMFRRKAPQPELEAWLFDAVTLQEFRAGEANRPYALRMKALSHVLDREAGVMPVLSGPDKLELQAKVSELREHGLLFRLDGLIQRNVEGFWKAGVDNHGDILKLKDVISVDLECVGVVEGEGKFRGMVGALEVMWKGECVQVSGGKLTDKERIQFWEHRRHGGCGSIVTKIVEVHALSITPDGNLREPRYQRIRDDKTEASE
jgi:DNA ligase-1